MASLKAASGGGFCGYMIKHRMMKGNWEHVEKLGTNKKKRWFVLANNKLHYFESNKSKTPKGVVSLTGAVMSKVPEDMGQGAFAFGIYMSATDESLVLLAADTYEMDAWVEALSSSIYMAGLAGGPMS